ncbi:MAG TPA: Asp-tRNA(Asn)/Glu-tRNA(Gln) amidotransferase GatCAB subunit B [Lachnospiraceae bacterium]|nr:Asp-tRNA(Asn)/Glu-tRNA(Gln) amidotransferase GatCAB subunit B [Lachnospiraceae bacterium]
MSEGFEKVIGLEIHVELKTKTKIFCGCDASFGGEPNTRICPVCTGAPGALPVLNKKVVEYALAVCLSLNCDISRVSRFDRKNYFYPDNPQNYQISQLYSPIGTNGFLDIASDVSETGTKRVRIHELHMEEDAGKLIHESGTTKIDYNRSGVPLIEIVTEPDLSSADEVISFLKKLRTTLIYLGVSDVKMNEGSMRVDVNLSLKRSGSDELGCRTEMKNLNSFKAIAHAIENEAKRQADILLDGRTIELETRRWDDERQTSTLMRSKEDARDYRYFPDPDLTPLMISDEMISAVRESLPELPDRMAKRFRDTYHLSEYDTDQLISEPALARLFEETCALGSTPKQVANRLMSDAMRLLNERGESSDSIRITPEELHSLTKLCEKHVINSTTAKEIFDILYDEPLDVRKYVEEHGLSMMSDHGKLQELAKRVMEENPKSVSDYRSGKEKAIGFLIGQMMKASRGQADPELARDILINELRIQ